MSNFTELDAYLFGQGTHYDIFRKLGSHKGEKDGKKELTVGASEMEPGMTLTFRRLCHGDSAVLILPPHFAKGLIGDMDRIPPHSVVVYFVRIND